MKPDWANLEELPLSLILDKLGERIDHVWFGAVCKRWRSVAKLNHQNHQFRTENLLPMLMIPTTVERRKIIKVSLCGILSDTVYPLQLHLPQSKKCCGSSHGWLALVDYYDVVTLLNPFNKYIAPITLPPFKSVRKVTLSADPITSPNDYVVVAICNRGGYLAYIRAGQTFWTFIDTDYCDFVDVTFYKGLAFAVDESNLIVSFNPYLQDHLGNEKITPHVVSDTVIVSCGCLEPCLVKSITGDLWMVLRSLDMQHGNCMCKFLVYKLKLNAQSGELTRLDSLEDSILFLGGISDSISVSASYFSKSLKKDSIYYADDLNLKIYNIKYESFVPRRWLSSEQMPPLSFWVLPHFQWD